MGTELNKPCLWRREKQEAVSCISTVSWPSVLDSARRGLIFRRSWDRPHSGQRNWTSIWVAISYHSLYISVIVSVIVLLFSLRIVLVNSPYLISQCSTIFFQFSFPSHGDSGGWREKWVSSCVVLSYWLCLNHNTKQAQRTPPQSCPELWIPSSYCYTKSGFEIFASLLLLLGLEIDLK